MRLAWDEAAADLAAAGVVAEDAETEAEFARRAGAALDLDERVRAGLAADVARARYSTEPIGWDDAARAHDARRAISEAIRARTGRLRRFGRHLAPRRAARYSSRRNRSRMRWPVLPK